jgi:anthrone oxygenase-like protein
MPHFLARHFPDTTATALSIARFGLAQAFFGNVYEAVARIPDRLARERDLAVPAGEAVTLPAMLRSGSPVRFHLPVGPVVLGATASALVAGRGAPPARRRWSMVSAAGTLVAVSSTAYVVRAINVPLFFAPDAPAPGEREALLRRWHALNTVRTVATAVAWAAARRAGSSPR